MLGVFFWRTGLDQFSAHPLGKTNPLALDRCSRLLKACERIGIITKFDTDGLEHCLCVSLYQIQ